MAADERPELHELIARLTRVPEAFLQHATDVPAALSDRVRRLVQKLGGQLDPIAASAMPTDDAGRKRAGLVACAVFLFEDPWFETRGGLGPGVQSFLATGLDAFSTEEGVDAETARRGGDLAEELARRCLAGVGLLPSGEKLTANDGRIKELHRARHVRAAIEKKASEAAAAKVSRE